MYHHLLFEGAELSGKSWIMSQVYNQLESKYNQSGFILDGCHWFNCDVGIFGTEYGRPVIKDYLQIFQTLEQKNILVEKLHLSDIVYNRVHRGVEINYSAEEKELKRQGFKIVLVTFPEDEEILQKRLDDRLKLYPHYDKIKHEPDWYIRQQQEYLKEIKKSSLPYLLLETRDLPDDSLAEKILKWIGEK